jgi:chromosome segregation ATPase
MVSAIRDQRVSEIAQALLGLPTNGNDLVNQARAAVGEVEKSATALKTVVDATKQASEQLARTESDTLTELPNLKEALGAICAAAANLKAQTASAQKIALQASAAPGTQEEWTGLLGSLDTTQEAASQALEAAQLVRENHSPLDKNKPETLNKVVALQRQLSAMNSLVHDTKTEISEAKEAIEGLPTSKLLKAEARTTMAALDEAIDRLVALATNANDTAAPLDIDEPATMAGLPEAKKLAKEAHGAAQEIESKEQTAVGALQAASAPPQITRETIQTMVVTLQQDPNIARIADFWQTQGN